MFKYKECQYRNCNKSFYSIKENQKFCCVKCKRNEKKYEQRENNSFKEEKDHIFNMLEQLKNVDPATLELYNKIYCGK